MRRPMGRRFAAPFSGEASSLAQTICLPGAMLAHRVLRADPRALGTAVL